MKYYLLSVKTYKDKTADKKSVIEFIDDEISTGEVKAIAAFHNAMGSAMNDANCASIIAMAFNSVGGIYKNEAWSAPVKVESTEAAE